MNLFTELVDKEKLHPNFISVKKDPYKISILEKWADKDIVTRDGNNKFIKEFQTTFNSSLWELYCYQVLLKLGCYIELKYDFPDFVFNFLNEKMLIECTIANNSEHMPPEYNYNYRFQNQSMDDIVYEQVLRLSNSFNSKYKKYLSNYVNHPWVQNKPFIIAIAPYEQPNFMLTGNEAIHLLLFGWRYLRESQDEELVTGIYKNEDTIHPIGLFKSNNYENVSAFLFSNVATDGKIQAMSENPNCTFGQIRYNLNYDRPLVQIDSRMKHNKFDLRCDAIVESTNFVNEFYNTYTIRRPLIKWESNYHEDICDGLTLYVNPFAKNPIKEPILNEMYNSGINIVEYDIDSDTNISRIHDYSLIQRVVYNINKSF